jgi:hypothetical protein
MINIFGSSLSLSLENGWVMTVGKKCPNSPIDNNFKKSLREK